MLIRFYLNNESQEINTDPDRRVVDLLREDLGLTGSKEGCGAGECGACAILVDGVSKLSCLMLAAQLEGHHITTIEGFSKGEELHPIQRAFVKQGAVQCGFCTPGMVIATADLLKRSPQPTRSEIKQGLSGNLCRCTGYQKIVDAVETVAVEIVAAEIAAVEIAAVETAAVEIAAVEIAAVEIAAAEIVVVEIVATEIATDETAAVETSAEETREKS